MDRLISLQAAIDAVQHAFDRKTLLNSFVRKVAVDALKTLPSAQPEERTEKRTETHACDCVSRQEVLDLIEMSMNDLEYDNENEELQYAVRSLPSAKLNFDMTTKIDKAYDDGYKAGYLQAKHDWGDKDE